MDTPKRFVYVLRCTQDPTRYYVGLTSSVSARVDAHNSGHSKHTARLRPWQLVVSLEFANEESAALFERYLKSGSGRAFAKRHFV
jgi:predicted GIY-YIG superfamily endonuclease